MNSTQDSYGDMGGAFFMLIGVIVLIWAALRHSDSKIQQNTMNQVNQQQAQAKAAFTRDFNTGNNPYDSQDVYLSERLTDYAQATKGGDRYETVKHIAGMLGGFKSVVADSASKATADMIKNQIENNGQNMKQVPGQAPQAPPQQPIIIEQPRRRQRQVIIEEPDREPEYIYRPRRPYGHYDY